MTTQILTAELARSLAQLTPREAEVLAHLSQHKTSKQIGLDLDIHENTLNKAIASVRSKWQTRDRYETAQVYQRLTEGVGNHPPQILPHDDDTDGDADDVSDLPTTATFRLSDVFAIEHGGNTEVPPPAGLEVLDSWFGRGWRFAAIPVLALLVAATALVVTAIATSLS
ncbi:helix-turn-helix transcriptional regulator [Tsuneonella amylolytica]|uniref:helix-turn-helix transcriptional regulator n=1 Tax=Tsuneonella amylolytica TaxID=2338327 RepID=UPI0013C4017D|nr:helix-turn-helix transcriptional regulator [Tsuneonella amylolytica]